MDGSPLVGRCAQDYAQRFDVVRSASGVLGDFSSIRSPFRLSGFEPAPSRDVVDEAISSVAAMSMALCRPAYLRPSPASNSPGAACPAEHHPDPAETLTSPGMRCPTSRLPPSLVREVTLNGTPEEIVDQVAVWRDHGVRHVALTNLSGLQPSLQKALASNGSFTGLMRKLKKL